jgi:hypothetical protein
MGAVPSLLLAVSTCFGGGFEELAVGEEVWGLAAGFFDRGGQLTDGGGAAGRGAEEGRPPLALCCAAGGRSEEMKGL